MSSSLFQLRIDLMPKAGDEVPNNKKPSPMRHALLIGSGPTGSGVYLKLGGGFLQIEDLSETHPLMSFFGDYHVENMPPELNNLVCVFMQPNTNYAKIMAGWAMSNRKPSKDCLPGTKGKNKRNDSVREKLKTRGIELPPRK